MPAGFTLYVPSVLVGDEEVPPKLVTYCKRMGSAG